MAEIVYLGGLSGSGFLLFGYFGVSNWLPSYPGAELGIKFKEMALYMVGTFITMIFAKIHCRLCC